MRPANSNKLSILILNVMISPFLLGISGCPGDAPELKWKPTIWVGDARTEQITRKQNGRPVFIKCSDAAFDEMICMHNSEPGKAQAAYVDVINQCETWKSEAAAQAAEDFR